MMINSIPNEWLPRYTYKDYEKWGGDWELIYGFPYAMSPSPKRLHQLFERHFMRIVEDALDKKNAACNCSLYHELDWIIDENTVVRPDVMIVCGKFEEDFLRFPPTLILEIASDATRLKDRNIKFKLYEASGVNFYLMADIERKNIEIYALKNNQYEQINTSTFHLTSSCTIDLDFSALWQ